MALVLGASVSPLAADPGNSDPICFKTLDEVIFNPERGLYQNAPLRSTSSFPAIRAKGFSLCYANITLDDHRAEEIPEPRLVEIDDTFTRMRAAGLKGIVRVNYNEDAIGIDTTTAWMEIHLQQLRPKSGRKADAPSKACDGSGSGLPFSGLGGGSWSGPFVRRHVLSVNRS